QGAHFLDGVSFSIWAEMAEVNPTVQLDPGQDGEKAGVQLVEFALLHRDDLLLRKGPTRTSRRSSVETEPPAKAEKSNQGWRKVVKGRCRIIPREIGSPGTQGDSDFE